MDLRDKLKFWMALSNYVDMIVRGTSPLSLPDAIADSLSYVKAFGGTEQRNIPQPYTQVNYVTNTAQTAVDTGIMIDFAKNYEFEVECRATTNSWYILQSRASSSGNITGISGATSGSTITLVVGNVTVCTSAITRTVGNKLYVKATLNAGTATLYVKDETANTEDTQTGSYGTTQPNPTAAVYLLGNAGGQYVDVNSDIYMARIKENDTVVMDYVPARQVATAGFYDKASGTFKTALTPANLSADGNTVPTPDAPMDIVSNNGVLKARHQSGLPLGYTLLEYVSYLGSSINLGITGFDDATSEIYMEWKTDTASVSSNYQSVFNVWTDNNHNSWRMLTYLTDTEKYYVYANAKTPALASDVALDTWHDLVCKSGQFIIDNTTYNTTVSSDLTVSTRFISIGGQLKNYYKYIKIKRQGEWIANFVPAKRKSDGRAGLYDLINNRFFGSSSFTAGPEVSDPVEIYTDGTVETIKDSLNNTATAEMLLKVGDYQDVQSIIDGAVTRNVGIKIFNGTETGDNGWNITTTIIYSNFPRQVDAVYNTNAVICSHSPNTKIDGSGSWISGFSITKFPTVADLNTFCAEQYAAGTPVTVIYPLAQAVTEQVAPQVLNVQTGDNILEITQASLPNLELEAKYQKSA